MFAGRGRKYPEDDAKAIIVQILNVVAFCHLQGVVHRDLKPENFLFTSSGEDSDLKLIDFGLSDFVRPDERLNDIVGSAYYVAPEVLHRSYSLEADIWSIGVITFILLCGSRPFWRHEPEVGENSAAKGVNKRSQPKCVLIDWGADDTVAEGRIISSDPDEIVNDSRLGPTDVKVLVDTATVPDAFLWRPAAKMSTIEEAVGQMIAWPASKCINLEPEDIAPLGARTNSLNKYKLLDLSTDGVVVAEGRWQTQEPSALVNGLPLGPKAVKVFVDVVHIPDTFIWRPTMDMTYLDDCLMSFVAWPAVKVIFESTTDGTGGKSPLQHSASAEQTSGGISATGSKSRIDTVPPTGSKSQSEKSPATCTKSGSKISKSYGQKSAAKGPNSPVRKTQLASQYPIRRSPRINGAGVIKENMKCKLMDISGKKQVVAEGRVHSVDPEQKVHFVRLGSNAARVWVDIVKVDDATVWRPSDEIEYMTDALGSSIAWPMDKLVIF